MAVLLLTADNGSIHAEPPTPPLVLFSTDVAIGLNDTHGAQGSCPVPSSGSYVNAQNADDGFTLAMALNLDAEGLVDVDAIVPTFGNASLPAEMLVARQIAWTLKGRTDLPIIPGALSPASQTLQPASQWFDGRVVAIDGPDGSFVAACRNPGVELMRALLLASDRPMTLLAIGPLTDVACLLTSAPEVAPKIAEVIVLASRIEGESLTINGKVVNDFNFRMDPLGGTLFLEAAGKAPVRLMAFSLSGQTSQKDDLIHFDASTLKGPSPPTPESEKSLRWLLAAPAPQR